MIKSTVLVLLLAQICHCRESKLSGLERNGFVKNVWYRRSRLMPRFEKLEYTWSTGPA